MPLLSWLRRSDPLLFIVGALLAAAVLVVYLQDQALRTLRQQRGVILQTMAERHAHAAADAIRHTFEAPLFDTLSAVNHPLLRDGRLDLVAGHYARGLDAFPQIERFFLWTEPASADPGDDVLFFDRAHATPAGAPAVAGFYREPALGRALRAAADRHARSQRIYAAVEDTVGGRRYHILFRLFWVDARRDRYFAVLGYLVDLDAVRTTLFDTLHARHLRSLLTGADGAPGFSLAILDEHERPIFASGEASSPIGGRATFPLRFYPGEAIQGRLAAATPERLWHVRVTPAADPTMTPVNGAGGGYWPAGTAVLLIVIALGFMLQGRRRAAELSRMQATFISHVSHQLKTPLALLSAAGESLTFERARTPDKAATYLAIMRSETARLSTIVERVLEFSRLEQGQRVYELEAIDLAALVRDTADVFRRPLEQDGFVFSINVPPAPLPVRADPAAFEQVLINLLDNAAKYSAGRRSIVVTAGTGGGDAWFEVSDRGAGIAPIDLPRIFDRFYRGSNLTADRRGFGLGLAIAREIVRAHRGRIDVRSQAGQGTTFCVSLPLLREGRDRLPRPVAADRLPGSIQGGPAA